LSESGFPSRNAVVRVWRRGREDAVVTGGGGGDGGVTTGYRDAIVL